MTLMGQVWHVAAKDLREAWRALAAYALLVIVARRAAKLRMSSRLFHQAVGRQSTSARGIVANNPFRS